MTLLESGHGSIDQRTIEFLYLLFVKCSTFRVWPPGHIGQPAEEGSLQLHLFNCDPVEPSELYDILERHRDVVASCGMKIKEDCYSKKKQDRKVAEYCQLRQCHPHDYQYERLFVQVNLYCSIEEDAVNDEAEYVKDRLQAFLSDNVMVGKTRLFLFGCTRQVDYTPYEKSAPKGFQHVLMYFDVITATLKSDDDE